jgi:maltose/moltooligosaccharide transporter
LLENEKSKEVGMLKVFVIGLAFFTTALPWSLYNVQVNQKLNGYLGALTFSGLLVGVLMALDNIVGVVIQPIMGSLSDKTRTKYGRRMPYIMLGIPLSALFFALIPTDVLFPGVTGFIMLLTWMGLFSISMALYRSQAVALMPDFVRPARRSKANAIINIMGGIGSILAYSLSYLIDVFANPNIGLEVTFIVAGIIMVLALAILFWRVKEKDAYSYKLLIDIEEKEGRKVEAKKEKLGLLGSIRDIFTEKDKSTLFILLAIFSWFVGYQGLEALFSIYAGNDIYNGVLGLGQGLSGFIFNAVAIPFIIAAFPMALLASKIGRRNSIKIGLAIIITALIVAFFFKTLLVTLIALICFGIGWALVNVNSIVIVWELAPTLKKIGTYTGLYYFFSVLAAILGPAIIGFFRDVLGKGSLLLDGAIFFLLAFIFMWFVKRGEIELTEEEKLARQKAIQEL